MSNPGQKWNLKYQRILMYSEKGMSNTEIGTKLSLSPFTVSHIKGSDEFLIRQTNFRRSVIEQVQGVFEKRAKNAAKQVCDLMKSGTSADKVKLEAAKDILDRIGYKPIEIVETRKREYTPQEVLSALSTVHELETTMDRLDKRSSRYVLDNPTRDKAELDAENAEKASQAKKDLKNETADPASSDRPKTEPEKPILPL